MQSLRDTIVFLTGATRGIGRAIALRLARDGARLALCGRDAAALRAAADALRAAGAPEPFARPFDLADAAAIEAFYGAARERLGPPAVLINNAGYNERKAPLWEVELGEFDRMLAVNLRAPFLLMRAAFPDMRARGGGCIVNILSTVCHFDNETMSVYTAAKKGLMGLTDVFRKEARPFNIRVASIYPGGTDTAFRPAPRPDYLKPESVAEAVCAVLALPAEVAVHHLTLRPMVETNF
ncbi:MAG TPA: SDR family oxidoreductase [Planctomycetota bacterium]|nr:SDR family oxidoreductase [Planctomycetota bacterium]